MPRTFEAQKAPAQGEVVKLDLKVPKTRVDLVELRKKTGEELGRRPQVSCAFIIERADRLLFGSDLVVFHGARAADYASRYWALRWLWEGEGERPFH